ncbi:MAG: TolC family protein, partial [Planctomycetota bacterium]|nr:TolC family protein [Planctomycetota bacterium]
ITVGTLFPGNSGTQFSPLSSTFTNLQFATATYTHQVLPKSRAFGSDAPQSPLDTWSYGLNAPWELDFWGRFRRAVDQKQAQLDQSVEKYDAALVLVLYDAAQNYVQVRKCQQVMASLRGTIKAQQKVLADSVAKEEAGTATVQDTAQARSNLARTEALILTYEKDLRGFSNALCVLLGMPPQDLNSRLGTGTIPTLRSR